jgi:hypothetical protein
MLNAADIQRAAETLHAMAEIPCLRGGVALFGEQLEGVGWYPDLDAADGGIPDVWVPVPETPDLEDCLLKVETAIEDTRRAVLERLEELRHGVSSAVLSVIARQYDVDEDLIHEALILAAEGDLEALTADEEA